MNDVGHWLAFVLQSAVILAMLYLAYKWLLARNTFYSLNRSLLMLSLAAAWMLPAAVPYLTFRTQRTAAVTVDFPVLAGVAETPTSQPDIHIDWIYVMEWAYLAGCVVALTICLAGALRMVRIIRSGRKNRSEGRTVVVSPAAPGPFSWGNFIVLRPEDCDADMDMVLEHEEAHLARIHWVDLAFAQLTAILQWFNPAAWLVIRELKNLHEYEVDADLEKRYGVDYQMMLIKKTVGPSFPTFADSLNHSQIKNRLTMMMKSHSHPVRRIAALGMPVMALLALAALSQPAVAEIISRFAPAETEAPAVSEGKVTDFHAEAQIEAPAAVEVATTSSETVESPNNVETATSVPANKVAPAVAEAPAPQTSEQPEATQEKVYTTVENLPEYKGGMAALMQFLTQNIKFPEGVKLDSPERAVVRFTVGKEGAVSDLRIMKSTGVEALDEEAMRVVKATSGQWTPGTVDGEPVAVQFNLPVKFAQTAE